jgi:hypothetical protein
MAATAPMVIAAADRTLRMREVAGLRSASACDMWSSFLEV